MKWDRISLVAVGIATAFTTLLWLVGFTIIPFPAILIFLLLPYMPAGLIIFFSIALTWVVFFIAGMGFATFLAWRKPKKCDNPADCFPY